MHIQDYSEHYSVIHVSDILQIQLIPPYTLQLQRYISCYQCSYGDKDQTATATIEIEIMLTKATEIQIIPPLQL